jgi:hypothetical protein
VLVHIANNNDGAYAPVQGGPVALKVECHTKNQGSGPIQGLPFQVPISAGEPCIENFGQVAGVEDNLSLRAIGKAGNYCTLVGVSVAGALNGPLPPVHVTDHGNGSYGVKCTIEKTGPYELSLSANNRSLGANKVTCIPAEASGKDSMAFGDGISKSRIGILLALFPSQLPLIVLL